MNAEQAYRILRSILNGRRRLKPDERQALDYARVLLAERIVDAQIDTQPGDHVSFQAIASKAGAQKA